MNKWCCVFISLFISFNLCFCCCFSFFLLFRHQHHRSIAFFFPSMRNLDLQFTTLQYTIYIISYKISLLLYENFHFTYIYLVPLTWIITLGENAICRLQLYSSLCLMFDAFHITNYVAISLLLLCYFAIFSFTSIFIQIYHSNIVQAEKNQHEVYIFIAKRQPKKNN